MNDKIDPCCTPGVLASVAWLLKGKDQCERSLSRQAHLIGLLRVARTGERWKCNGEILGRLIERRIRSGALPGHGAILIGIGEMIARSHAPDEKIERRLGFLFRRSCSDSERLKRLREALDIAKQCAPTKRRSLPTAFEPVTLSIMDWKQLNFANDWVQHPRPFGVFVGYGLGFITRLLLRNSPNRLRWFAAEADKRKILPAVVASLGEACCWDRKAAHRALQSGVPFFIGLGVARLRDGGEEGKGWNASSINKNLVMSGVSEEGRIHVSAFMLKEAVHAWHRQKNRPQENRRRQAVLQLEPRHAVGGEAYANDEIQRLSEEESVLEARQTSVMRALNDALQTAAQQDVDPKKLWSIFEPSLVDTPEIRHRFAMAHTEGAARCAALKASLAIFDEVMGVRHPETVCHTNFDRIRVDREFAFWMACSQIELSKSIGRDVGHDAARRIGRVEKSLRNFVLQPFAASRFGLRFQDALYRWSSVLQFAFLVALSDLEAPLVQLRNHALESARPFLWVANRSAHDLRWVDPVIRLVVDAVSTMEMEHAWAWINDKSQPALLHAQLVWSHPSILEKKLALAKSLIEQVSARETSPTVPGYNAFALLDIVDRAASAFRREGRLNLAPLLNVPYSMAAMCEEAPLARSLPFDTLLAALSNEPEARKFLLENPVWGRSRVSEELRR